MSMRSRYYFNNNPKHKILPIVNESLNTIEPHKSSDALLLARPGCKRSISQNSNRLIKSTSRKFLNRNDNSLNNSRNPYSSFFEYPLTQKQK